MEIQNPSKTPWGLSPHSRLPHKLAKVGECTSVLLQGGTACSSALNVSAAHRFLSSAGDATHSSPSPRCFCPAETKWCRTGAVRVPARLQNTKSLERRRRTLEQRKGGKLQSSAALICSTFVAVASHRHVQVAGLCGCTTPTHQWATNITQPL